jgi:lipopolysaccharide cholinephosphotransferase
MAKTLNQEELRKVQLLELKILKEVKRICAKHDIKYFLTGGTLIGAVRHKGFIPWDDDIDIYMFRKDYNKLIALEKEIYDRGYKIMNIGNTDNYYLKFSKIVDKNTTLWERREIPCIIGTFVDVFPLDFCNAGLFRRHREWYDFDDLMNIYRLSIEDHTLTDYVKQLVNGHFIQCAKWVKYRFKNSKHIRENIIAMENKLEASDGLYLVNYTEDVQCLYPKEWFSDYILMPFEDIQVRVPVGYKEYLTYTYGDYMELPPVEERVSLHLHYYYNTEKGLPLEKVKKLIKDSKYRLN